MSIHLIRHAHAGSRSDWADDDEVRPLSNKGRSQAEAIAQNLLGAGVDLIWSSRFLRCRQTVEPLATELGLSVVDAPLLAEGSSGAEALRALLEAVAQGHTVAACSHGDVIPAIVQTALRQGVALEGPVAPRKGARYEFVVAEGAIDRIVHTERP